MCCSPVSVKAYEINEDELGKECSMHGRVHKCVRSMNLNEETF